MMVSSPASLGLWNAANEVRSALHDAGWPIDISDSIPPERPAHVHFGNSARQYLPALAHRSGDVVTVHDARPRNRLVRETLGRVQGLALRRHRIVTHSHFATELLRSTGWKGEATVIPSILSVAEVAPDAVSESRSAWGADGYDLTVVSAGQIRMAKGLDELLAAARARPTVLMVLVGSITDPEAEALIAGASLNVVHVSAPDDEQFCVALAAADAVLNIRRDSVGETSGPVVQAHRLGRPVAGFLAGTLPEACGPGDTLIEPSATATDLLDSLLEVRPAPLDPSAPQIPRPADVAELLIGVYRSMGWEQPRS